MKENFYTNYHHQQLQQQTHSTDEMSDNNTDSICQLNEADLLRKDSKSLVWSLKQHQNAIKQSISKLITHQHPSFSSQAHADQKIKELIDDDEEYDNVSKCSHFDDQWEQSIKSKHQDEEEAEAAATAAANYILSLKNRKSKRVKKSAIRATASVKTVSFSDYLRTCYEIDSEDPLSGLRRRRSRSVSPYLNKKPTKSILKKQIVQDELSEDDEIEDNYDEPIGVLDTFSLNNQAASSSHSSESLNSAGTASTNSLLCSDIYGGFNAGFDENPLGDELSDVNADSASASSSSTQLNSKNNKFIDFISKKRQAFLNHNYYNDKNTNNSNTDEFKQQQLILNQEYLHQQNPISKKHPKHDLNGVSKVIAVTNTSRSYSADNFVTQSSRQSSQRKSSHTNSHSMNKTQSKSSHSHHSNSQKQTAFIHATRNSSTKQQSNPFLPNQQKISNQTNDNTNYKQNKLNSSLKKDKIRNYKKLMHHMKKSKPLLGYDWAVDTIETKLNTTNTKFEKPESYWQELSQFRIQNKDDCVSNKQANFDGSTSTFFEMDSRDMTNAESQTNANGDDDGRNHKCIHSYTLNERLFPVPIYKDKNGQSACPVCKSTRKEATAYCPQFFKISIPKSRIIQPYKIQANKRSNSKASEDTLSLAENCVAGYQNAPKKSSSIYNMPKSKTVDLKTATGIAQDMSKMTIDDVKRIQQNRDPTMSGVYNKAHAMRYELEDQHQKRLRELMPKIQST